MSDLLLPEQDARPWLPAGNVTALATLNEYDIPLSGLIEQGGTTFLYVCLLGELEELNIWAYSRPSQPELDRLTALVDDDLAAAIDAALADRVLVVALAHDHQLVNWVRIDAGVEGPLALAKRFVDQVRRRLKAEQHEVDELERQQALASR
jgi:hypothetical protein